MFRKQLLVAAGLLALAACRDPIAPNARPAGLVGVTLEPVVLAVGCREWFPVSSGVDLVISVPTTLTVTPTTVRPEGKVQLPSWTVKNQGTAASNAFHNGFYLSTDAWITAADVYLGGNSNSALAPGASHTWGGPSLTIPATTAPGKYFIGILVDRTNTTPEGVVGYNGAPLGRECNNFKSTPLYVGGGIAFHYNDAIYVMNADGTGVTRLTDNIYYRDEHPAWSPDGRWIAFARDYPPHFGLATSTKAEVYVINANGTGERNLTNHGADDTDPAWSPDSSKIAFASNRDGNWEIYVMNHDGTNPERLTDDLAEDTKPAWSPDGSKIAFQRESPYGYSWYSDIYVMNADDGSEQQNLTDSPHENDYDPAWSPDGLEIAFACESFICVMNAADGTGKTPLTTSERLEWRWDSEPAWSPNGSKIAFTRYIDGHDRVYVVNRDGSWPHALSIYDGSAAPSWVVQP